VVERGRARSVVDRADVLAVTHRARPARRPFAAPGTLVRVADGLRARRERQRQDAVLAVELPVVVDLLAVAVTAGHTPFLALEVAARWSPPTTAAELDRVLHECGFGATLERALGALSTRRPPMRAVCDALMASDRLGAPVADALERVAVGTRAAIRRRAEAHARTVPVRLLFPLVLLVLPAFGLLTVVPTVAGRLAGS
jgi:tight adherence protein C